MARVKKFRDHTSTNHIREYHLGSWRAWKSRVTDLELILDWCDTHGRSFNAILNSVLPAINYSLHNNTFKHLASLYVNMDFGDVKICVNDKD